jgi:hypothetical protein
MPGTTDDLQFLRNDLWLHNTEVRYRIVSQHGRWHVIMVFIAVETPLKFLCRGIDHYETEKKALLYAQLLQRNIRKDARGNLKTNTDALHICDN